MADVLAPPAADLLAAMEVELDEMYGAATGTPFEPAHLAPPHGLYLVAWAGDTPVGGGGLRRLSDSTAEIKRMFVLPAARGRGVAAVILAGLEAAAASLGYTAVRLDTGPRQPHAERLYRAAGYAPIPDYNRNPRASFWGEKPL